MHSMSVAHHPNFYLPRRLLGCMSTPTPTLCAGVGFREQSMPKISERNPDSAPGDWFIDQRCIDCAASRTVAPGCCFALNPDPGFASNIDPPFGPVFRG